jgi:hypothetical protein
MPNFKRILVFALRVLVVYALLIAPWPGLKPLYARYFQGLGRMVFVDEGGRRSLEFQPLGDPEHAWPPNFDTGIIMANRNRLDAQGQGPRFLLTADAWQMGWAPTAFFMSLVLATPIPWRRRLRALGWGLVWVHGFILLTVGIFLWNESTRVALVTLTPFWKAVANRLEELALDPVGPGFFAAALIWMVVTFRRRDLADKP